MSDIEDAVYKMDADDLQDYAIGNAEAVRSLTAERDQLKAELENVVVEKMEHLRDIEKLRARVEKLEKALREAREQIEEHDNAPFQCESTEGAEAVSNARSILDSALAAPDPQ